MSISSFLRVACVLGLIGWVFPGGGLAHAADPDCTVLGERWPSFGDCVHVLELAATTGDADAEARQLFERAAADGTLPEAVFVVMRQSNRSRLFSAGQSHDWAWWRSFDGRWHVLDDDPEDFFEDIADGSAEGEFLPGERIEARYRLSRILRMRGRESAARETLRKAGWLLGTAVLTPQLRLAVVAALGRDPVANRDEWIAVSDEEIALWIDAYTSAARELGVLDPDAPVFMWAPVFDARCVGEVKLRVLLDADGRVTSASAISPTMPAACLDGWRAALQRWRYPPSDAKTIPATREVEWAYRSW